ncbi:MAG: histidinol-phosphate transaminase [Gammaproteobacteria bacterium]|nr:MAG: histidinol-phosphate transaminase [Gammaproteobacteria bacterium]
MSYERDIIHDMQGYTWGEQPRDGDAIKLNTNENPYPPGPAVAAALASFDVATLNLYPQPTADQFRALAAERHGVDMENLLVTNGGDEALRLAFTTFLDPGSTFATTDPSYSLYEVLAAIQGCSVLAVPLLEDWTVPRNFAQALNDAGARLACIVNPHTPTGVLASVDTLSRVANEFSGVLLIDEAYVDFVDAAQRYDTMNMMRAFDNVLILRTLSKGYSMAGLRFGYLIGSAELIEPMLTKTRDSYNVNTIAQRLGCAAFEDLEYAEQTWRRVRSERRELRDSLLKRGFAMPHSQANFLLATMPDDSSTSASGTAAELRSRGILVRHFETPRLDDKLRISIGTPEQNARLLVALDEILAQ